MKQISVLEQAVSTFGKGYEYGDPIHKKQSRTGQDKDHNGLKEVDCSYLVAQAYLKSGFDMGLNPASFTTHSIFNQRSLTPLAQERFDFINKADSLDKKSLQAGDIVMFMSKDGSTQHIGIFQSYDKAGHPVFFGSQHTHGPGFATIGSNNTYWNGKDQVFLGALRPKVEYFGITPADITQQTSNASVLKPQSSHANNISTVQTMSKPSKTSVSSNPTQVTHGTSDSVKALVNFLKSSGVEGFRSGIYADTVGVPTVGNGFALVVHGGKNTGWVVRPEAELKQLFMQAGLLSSLYAELPHDKLKLAAQRLQAQDTKGAAQLFGDGKQVKTGEFSLTTTQADRLSAAFIDKYIVPLMAKGMGIAPKDLSTKLTVGEFVAIGSRLYQTPAWLSRAESLLFRHTFSFGLKDAAADLLSIGRGLRGQKEHAAFHNTSLQAQTPIQKNQVPAQTIASQAQVLNVDHTKPSSVVADTQTTTKQSATTPANTPPALYVLTPKIDGTVQHSYTITHASQITPALRESGINSVGDRIEWTMSGAGATATRLEAKICLVNEQLKPEHLKDQLTIKDGVQAILPAVQTQAQQSQQPRELQHLVLEHGAAIALTRTAGAVQSCVITDQHGNTVLQADAIHSVSVDDETGVVHVELNGQGETFAFEPRSGHTAWQVFDEQGNMRYVVMDNTKQVLQNNVVEAHQENARYTYS